MTHRQAQAQLEIEAGASFAVFCISSLCVREYARMTFLRTLVFVDVAVESVSDTCLCMYLCAFIRPFRSDSFYLFAYDGERQRGLDDIRQCLPQPGRPRRQRGRLARAFGASRQRRRAHAQTVGKSDRRHFGTINVTRKQQQQQQPPVLARQSTELPANGVAPPTTIVRLVIEGRRLKWE